MGRAHPKQSCDNPNRKKVAMQKICLLFALSLPSLALADTFTYTFITGQKNVGHLNAETNGDQ